MGDPLCLKDMGVPPCTGEGGEALGVSSVPGKQLWYGLETSSGGLWRLAVVDCGVHLCCALDNSPGNQLWYGLENGWYGLWSPYLEKISGSQFWYGLETSSGVFWRPSLVGSGKWLWKSPLVGSWRMSLVCSGKQLWKTPLMGPGKHLCWALENISGRPWRPALMGSGTSSTEGGLKCLFLGPLGQAVVPGWALEISACLFLYQQRGMLRINPTDLGSTGALSGGLSLFVLVRRKSILAGNGAAANALFHSPGHALSVGWHLSTE